MVMGNRELGFRVMMFALIVPVTFWIVIRWGAGPDGDVIGPTIGWTVIAAASLIYGHGVGVRKADREVARQRDELRYEMWMEELSKDES